MPDWNKLFRQSSSEHLVNSLQNCYCVAVSWKIIGSFVYRFGTKNSRNACADVDATSLTYERISG